MNILDFLGIKTTAINEGNTQINMSESFSGVFTDILDVDVNSHIGFVNYGGVRWLIFKIDLEIFRTHLGYLEQKDPWFYESLKEINLESMNIFNHQLIGATIEMSGEKLTCTGAFRSEEGTKFRLLNTNNSEENWTEFHPSFDNTFFEPFRSNDSLAYLEEQGSDPFLL